MTGLRFEAEPNRRPYQKTAEWLGRLRRSLLPASLLVLSATPEARAQALEEPPHEVTVHRTRFVEVVPAPKVEPDSDTLAIAQRIDALLYEAVQDLGLSVAIAGRGAQSAPESEQQLIESASQSWIVAPQLERRRGRLVLKLVAVPPGSQVLYTTTAVVQPADLEMRVVLMMRDLMQAARRTPSSEAPTPGSAPSADGLTPARSPGRGILALNAALFGGFVGYSVQHASGSTDERLTYPLAALGAGVGLGGSMLIADEWDIGVGDAWFLSAGMWWPTVSGTLIASSYSTSRSERYSYGLLGATAGLTLATTALGFGHVNDGGALLAHSGGAFGTLLGGLIELSIRGTTDVSPQRGIGYGAGAGVLLASALATQVQPSAPRMLMLDLSASLGALAGAAAASPALLVDESEGAGKTRNRIWLASIGAGTLIGGAIGWWMTRPAAPNPPPSLPLSPSVGLLAITPQGPALGVSLQGQW